MSEYLSRVPQGTAFADGKYMPISELSVSIVDLGFTQGAATYDVAHVIDKKFFRLDWNLERFYTSAQGLSLSIPYTKDHLTEILSECVRRSHFKNAFVWMGVTQGIPQTGNPRDYESAEPRFYAYAKEYYGISSEKDVESEGVHISISNVIRIPPESVDPTLKNHHWLDLRKAQLEAEKAGFDTTVLQSLSGTITEGPGFNVMAVKNGVVMTPNQTALEGITTRAIQALCDEHTIPFVFLSLTPDFLKRTDEVFLTSASGGITPVLSVDAVEIAQGKIGPLTKRLQSEYWKKHTDPAWTTPIE